MIDAVDWLPWGGVRGEEVAVDLEDVHEPLLSVFFVVYLDMLHEPCQVTSLHLLCEHTRRVVDELDGGLVSLGTRSFAIRSNSTLSILALLDATVSLATDARCTKNLQVFLRIQAAPRQRDNVVELKVLRSATMLAPATVVVTDVLSNL